MYQRTSREEQRDAILGRDVQLADVAVGEEMATSLEASRGRIRRILKGSDSEERRMLEIKLLEMALEERKRDENKFSAAAKRVEDLVLQQPQVLESLTFEFRVGRQQGNDSPAKQTKPLYTIRARSIGKAGKSARQRHPSSETVATHRKGRDSPPLDMSVEGVSPSSRPKTAHRQRTPSHGHPRQKLRKSTSLDRGLVSTKPESEGRSEPHVGEDTRAVDPQGSGSSTVDRTSRPTSISKHFQVSSSQVRLREKPGKMKSKSRSVESEDS